MSETRWLTESEQSTWRSLMAMHDRLSEFLDRQLRSTCGLSRADYEVLAHLSEAPDGRLRPFELVQLLRWEKSRLSQHLGRMETRHLISRERCASDQRGAVVVITSEGQSRIKEASPQHVFDVREAVIDHLSTEELASLRALAEKITDRVRTLGK